MYKGSTVQFPVQNLFTLLLAPLQHLTCRTNAVREWQRYRSQLRSGLRLTVCTPHHGHHGRTVLNTEWSTHIKLEIKKKTTTEVHTQWKYRGNNVYYDLNFEKQVIDWTRSHVYTCCHTNIMFLYDVITPLTKSNSQCEMKHFTVWIMKTFPECM